MVKWFMLILMACVLAACGNQLRSQSSQPSGGYQQSQSGEGQAVQLEAYSQDETVNEPTVDGVESVQTRIVLKNAALTLVVENAEADIKRIADMAEGMGGWVVVSNTSQTALASGGEVARGSITIRIPADHLADTITAIKTGALSVENESITGEDVTQNYVDLTSQVNNLRAAEAQLQLIMDDARNTEDILNIYNELVRIRGEIETAQGRIRYYDEASAFSSITVNLIPEAIDAPIQIAGWSPGRTAESALAALINVLRFAADLLITVIVLVVPLVLILGLPVWLIYRLLRKWGIIRPLAKAPVATTITPE